MTIDNVRNLEKLADFAHEHRNAPVDIRVAPLTLSGETKPFGWALMHGYGSRARIVAEFTTEGLATAALRDQRFRKHGVQGRTITNWQSGPAPTKLYNLVAINERTNKKTKLNATPLSLKEAQTMLTKFSPRRDARIQVEEIA